MRSSGNCSFLSKSQEDPDGNPRRPDITDRRVDLVSQDWTLRHKEGLGPNLQILTRWLSSNRWQGWKVSFYILLLGCQQGLKALYTSLRAFCPIKGQFPPLWPSKAFTQPMSYLVLWFLSYQLYFAIGYFGPRPAGYISNNRTTVHSHTTEWSERSLSSISLIQRQYERNLQ